MPDPAHFLDLVTGVAQAAPAPAGGRTLLYASVTGTDGSGRPLLKFEGENTATSAGWYRLSAYTPTTGDRVAVLLDFPGARSGLVLCKVL